MTTLLFPEPFVETYAERSRSITETLPNITFKIGISAPLNDRFYYCLLTTMKTSNDAVYSYNKGLQSLVFEATDNYVENTSLSISFGKFKSKIRSVQ